MRLTRRRSVAVIAAATAALLVGACAPEPGPADPNVKSVSNATLEWTVSREADNGAFSGAVNYWSAGRTDGTEATYVATDGDVTVLKANAAGTYVPIGSEPAVSWDNKNKNGNGQPVTAVNAFYLGQKVRLSNGKGTVNAETGVATIRWKGTFSINFYGDMVPFWIVDPVLRVDANGTGRLTATVGGTQSSQENPEESSPLPDRANVEIAVLPDVYATGSIATGFANAPTAYVGTVVTATVPQTAKNSVNEAYWGAWPQSFVDFHEQSGLALYWYTSGGSADRLKPQEPVSVSYTLAP